MNETQSVLKAKTRCQIWFGRADRAWLLAAAMTLCLISPHAHAEQSTMADEIVVTLLGTGTPVLNPKRFGPSILVQAGGLNLVFDAGRGASIRLAQVGVSPANIDALFFTHLHSDHVNGFSDLWMAGYMFNHARGGRQAPLRVYGGAGLAAMAEHISHAFQVDTAVRTEGRGDPPGAASIIAQEIGSDGVVFEEAGVRVTAFRVTHIEQSYGYRVDYGGKSILISGDTSFDQNVIEHGRGVDLLIHEVRMVPPGSNIGSHTPPEEAGIVFAQTNTKMGVYSHILVTGRDTTDPQALAELVARTRETYNGPLTVGSDLLRFVIRDQVEIDRSYVEE